jgi:hypothetical protein
MPDDLEALTPQQRKLVTILEARARRIVTEEFEAVRQEVRKDLDGLLKRVSDVGDRVGAIMLEDDEDEEEDL